MSITRQLFSWDPGTRIKTMLEHDSHSGKSQLQTTQDVTLSLEYNKARQNDPDRGYVTRDKAWRHAAHIPDIVHMEWKTKYGVDIYNKSHLPGIKRLLDQSDYSHLRISRFRLGKADS